MTPHYTTLYYYGSVEMVQKALTTFETTPAQNHSEATKKKSDIPPGYVRSPS